MNIIESIKMAFLSLHAHKLRSLLTMLGIIIGVGSVIAVVAIGHSGEAVLKAQFTSESNTIDISYVQTEEELLSPEQTNEHGFKTEDIKAIEKIPEVEKVVMSSSELGNVQYREENGNILIGGINQAYFDIKETEVINGRHLMTSDFISSARVAIVSEEIQEEYAEDGETILGKVIFINSKPIEIVGIIRNNNGLFDLLSNKIYLPLNTWQTLFDSSEITEVTVQTTKSDELEIVGEKVVDLMNTKYNREDAFIAINLEDIGNALGNVTRIMTIIISCIAGVSLLVGGIGVMNIMLVSVTERTREIGVRLALGATRKQILLQFLIEASTLTLVGGLIGIGLGTGVSFIVSYFAGWPLLISAPIIIGGVLFSMAIGVVFGLLPANKAAKLDPIDSLRYE